MLFRIVMVAALVMGSVELPAQGRRALRADSFGVPADAWCRDADRGNRYATSAFASLAIRGTTVMPVTRFDTTNGGVNIALEGSRWQGDGLDVETTNGGVRMKLPAGYNAELHTETNNGGIDIDFPITVRGQLADLRRRIDTTIGSGGAPLRGRTG